MKNYESPLSETKLNRNNMTDFYSHNTTRVSSMEQIEFGTNNINNLSDSYDQHKKLKEILTRELS